MLKPTLGNMLNTLKNIIYTYLRICLVIQIFKCKVKCCSCCFFIMDLITADFVVTTPKTRMSCLFSDAKLSVPIFIISFLYLKLVFLIQPFFFSNINIQGYTLPSSTAITPSHKFWYVIYYSLLLNMPVLISLWPYKCSEVRLSIIKHIVDF